MTTYRDRRHDVTVCIDNPRRSYPTLRIFLAGERLFFQDVDRDDARRIAQYVVDHAEDLACAAYPSAAVHRLVNAAQR